MISDFWILCALQGKRVVFGIILELKRRRRRKQTATSRHYSVVTSQRRDVWSTEEKVDERLNVAMSSRFLPQNHKKQRGPNFEIIKERKEESTKKKSNSDWSHWKDSRFVFFFSHKRLMIY